MIYKLCNELVFGEKFIILYIFPFGIKHKKGIWEKQTFYLIHSLICIPKTYTAIVLKFSSFSIFKNEIFTMEGMSFCESAVKGMMYLF